MSSTPAPPDYTDLLRQLIVAQEAHTKALRDVKQEPARMTYEQAKVELRFRAVRNALGSLGRRGGPTDVALISPLLHHLGGDKAQLDLEFTVGMLPENARFLLLSYRNQADREVDLNSVKRVRNRSTIVPDVGDVTGVQVDDVAHLPLRFGIPHRAPDNFPQKGN